MRIYEFFTQWLTLGMLFFIVDFYTEWLQVVTLGGLVAGSMLIGFWTTLLDRVGIAWANYLGGSTEHSAMHTGNTNALPEIAHKSLVLLGVLAGVYGLSMVMPGYTMEVTGSLVSFLVAYCFLAMFLGKQLQRNV